MSGRTQSAIFCVVVELLPTLLVDEADTFLPERSR
jgi:hypothetical protein